jgi:hypothetical protein
VSPNNALHDQTRGFAEGTRANTKQDPAETTETLARGVMNFYASDFLHADDEIEMYLQSDGSQYAGAAHFYLGASLLMQALIASPKDMPRIESLRQKARAQFVTAKELRYKPIKSSISPKILGEWMQIEPQQ